MFVKRAQVCEFIRVVIGKVASEILPVRNTNNQVTTWLQNAKQLCNRPVEVQDVFQHISGDDHVEYLVAIGKIFRAGKAYIDSLAAGENKVGEAHVNTKAPKLGKTRQQTASADTDINDGGAARCVARNQ